MPGSAMPVSAMPGSKLSAHLRQDGRVAKRRRKNRSQAADVAVPDLGSRLHGAGAVGDTGIDTGIDTDDVDGDSPEALIGSLVVDLERNLERARTALDAELIVSDLLGLVEGMLGSEVPDEDEVEEIVGNLLRDLISVMASRGRPAGLVGLRAMSVLGPDNVRRRAHQAAQRLATAGVTVPSWVAHLGDAQPSAAWVSRDVDGQQESLTLVYRHGDREHGITLLIDDTVGSGITACLVSEEMADHQELAAMFQAAPDVVLEDLSWEKAEDRWLDAAVQPYCPQDEQQAQTLASAHALLESRLALVLGEVRRPDLAFGRGSGSAFFPDGVSPADHQS